MARATADDQLKFLLSCVKHSNNGKVDFVEVAHEIGIVSKGAAAKRYERLMKANGINPTGGLSDRTTSSFSAKEKSKVAIAKAAAAKRRKIEGDRPDVFRRDEEEEYRGRRTKSDVLDAPQFIKHELPPYGFGPFVFPPMPTQQPPYFPYPSQLQTTNGTPLFNSPAPIISNLSIPQNTGHNQMQSNFPSTSTNYMLSNPALYQPVQTQKLVTTSIDDKSSIQLIDDFWNQDRKDSLISHVLDTGLQPLDRPRTMPITPQEVVLSIPEPASIPDIKQESTDSAEDTIAPENCILIAD